MNVQIASQCTCTPTSELIYTHSGDIQTVKITARAWPVVLMRSVDRILASSLNLRLIIIPDICDRCVPASDHCILIRTMGNNASASLDRSGRPSLQQNLVQQKNKLEDTYNISERSLGEGTATSIKQGTLKKYTKTERTAGVAIKLYDGKAEIQPDLKLEAEILRECDHPNIVKLFEVAHVGKHLSLVLELCSGGPVLSRAPYAEKVASHVVRQLCSAVAYLHSKNIVHRDIDCSNILFAKPDKYDVKLVDFGSATFLDMLPGKGGV